MGVCFLPSLGGLNHVPAAAIVGAYVQRDKTVVGGLVDGLRDQLLQGAGKAVRVAQHPQAHPVGVHGVDFFFQVSHEQPHEAADFFFGALPVFGAECEKTQFRDADLSTGFDNVPDPLRACRVTQGRGHEAFFGPTAVAVHDDGNVLRQGVGARGRQQKFSV